MDKKVISVHSFRRGTGKTMIVANVALMLAQQGYRVGVMDVNFPSPSLHYLFALDTAVWRYSLNDFIWGRCNIEDAAYDIPVPSLGDGRLFFVPASSRPREIARLMRGGYYVNLIGDATYGLMRSLDLDVLLLDTYAGLNEETQLAIALSDTLLIILRPDQQDYHGTSIIVEIGRRLGVPELLLVVNEVPSRLETHALKGEVERVYKCKVSAVFRHLQELMVLASSGIFALEYPHHPYTATFKHLALQLMFEPWRDTSEPPHR